jgi:hypothetical protein
MDIEIIGGAVYVAIGVILAIYWFRKYYQEEYVLLGEYAIPEMACLMMLVMAASWPIMMVVELLKKKV